MNNMIRPNQLPLYQIHYEFQPDKGMTGAISRNTSCLYSLDKACNFVENLNRNGAINIRLRQVYGIKSRPLVLSEHHRQLP